MVIKKFRRVSESILLVYPETICEWIWMMGRPGYISFPSLSGKTAWLRRYRRGIESRDGARVG